MLNNRVTQLLGIEHPIIQGAMLRISTPELAAAVSDAGGLGIIASGSFCTAEELKNDIRITKSLTNKPFGVNINLFPRGRKLPNESFIDTLIDEGITIVETSGNRSPEPYMDQLKKGNVKVIHKVSTVRHAINGEKAGADIIAVAGFEQGGNMGLDDVTTFVLVPRTVNSVSVPVLAGGGIADGRGLIAALALGAEGVVIGTRFMATKECPIHSNYKDWMVKSTEKDTAVVLRSIQSTHRVLKNKASQRVLELETAGAAFEDFFALIKGDAGQKVLDGEIDAGLASCGLNVGLIDDVISAKQVVKNIITQAEIILDDLQKARVK